MPSDAPADADASVTGRKRLEPRAKFHGQRVTGDDGGTSVILVLNQYKRIGCSPGKHPDTRTMATGSAEDSRDILHDRYLCISV